MDTEKTGRARETYCGCNVTEGWIGVIFFSKNSGGKIKIFKFWSVGASAIDSQSATLPHSSGGSYEEGGRE